MNIFSQEIMDSKIRQIICMRCDNLAFKFDLAKWKKLNSTRELKKINDSR